MIWNFIGALAGFLFAISSTKTAWHAIRDGRTHMDDTQLMWTVFFGALLMIIFIWHTVGFNLIVTADYFCTITSWGLILRYYYFPRQ